jgi:gamma-tubulin complex component 4
MEMQHEVLLALSGCPGNTFAVSRQSGLFEVIQDLPFVHPSEVSLLNRICSLGTYYMQLRDFISQQTSSTCTLLNPSSPLCYDEGSLYLKAMAYGIDKVLDVYRQRLMIVERKCMGEPHIPISHIQHEFEEYHFLLPALDSCVKYIQRHKNLVCVPWSSLQATVSMDVAWLALGQEGRIFY